MSAIAATKSGMRNRLEGLTLTGLFKGVPTFAGAAMLLRLAGSSHIVSDAGGAPLFVAMATLFFAILTCRLGPKFPRFFRHSYEPLFMDAGLSLSEKVRAWRNRPETSQQLLVNVLLLSVLAVAVVSLG